MRSTSATWVGLAICFQPLRAFVTTPRIQTLEWSTSCFVYRDQVTLFQSSSNQGGGGSTISTATLVPQPTPPGQQTKLTKEFFSMMDEFAKYSDRDIQSIHNERQRALYFGVKAGATEPDVLRSFEVLYEDLAPLRVAGRMIYKNLKEVMEKHVEQRRQQEETIMQATGLSLEQIDDGRQAFMRIIMAASTPTTSKQEFGELPLKQLVDSGVVETIVELLGYQDFEQLVSFLDHDKDGKIKFEEFMIGLNQSCAYDDARENPECDIDGVLEQLTQRMEVFEARQSITKTNKEERKQRNAERYDEMVATFGEWEEYAPSGEGRMMDVLRGCFAGAKNKGVVEALKIVYTEYSALRMAGDLIYKLMEKLMTRQAKKR